MVAPALDIRSGELDIYTVEPTLSHENTVILLHGTSQTGPSFAAPLLSFGIPYPLPTSELHTLPDLFPHTRFVFPTGQKRNTTVFNGLETNAWFDIASFSDRTLNETLSIPGLRTSARLLAALIASESRLVPSSHIVLGGFSQGCAMTAILLLLSPFPLAGHAGLSGWLPFRKQVAENGRVYLRELLEWEGETAGGCERAWFGHGEKDEKMKVQWGMEMRDVLREVGVEVGWKSYGDLEHWWGQEEMHDLVGVLKGWFI